MVHRGDCEFVMLRGKINANALALAVPLVCMGEGTRVNGLPELGPLPPTLKPRGRIVSTVQTFMILLIRSRVGFHARDCRSVVCAIRDHLPGSLFKMAHWGAV